MNKPPELFQVFKQRVRELMEQKGLTGLVVAEKAGIRPAALSRYFAKGAPIPKLSAVAQLAQGLGCEPWELLKPIDTQSAPDAAAESKEEPSLADVLAGIRDLKREAAKASSTDPIIRETVFMLSQLDHERRLDALEAIRCIKVAADRDARSKKSSDSG